MRRKETEFEKQRAILQQKCELLELQLRESQEREDNIKKMHETLMAALKSSDSSVDSARNPRDIELANSLHKREIQEIRLEYEIQIKEFKQQQIFQEGTIKNLHLQMESLQIDNQRKQQDLELDKRDLENKIKKIELEKQQIQQQSSDTLYSKSQLLELQTVIEDKNIEMEKLKAVFEQQMNDLKQEKIKNTSDSEEQIQRLKQKIKQMETEIQVKFQNQIKDSQEKYIKEVEDLQNQMYDMQKRQREEILVIMQEKDEMQEKAQKFEKQLEKLKSAPKPVTIHLSEENFNSSRSTKQQNSRLVEENDYLNIQVSKLSQQIREMREEVSSYQTNERALKREIHERFCEIDNQKLDYQRKLNEERRKLASIEDENSILKIEIEKKKSEHLKQQNEKDNQINMLKKQLMDFKKGNNLLLMQQSPIAVEGSNIMSQSRDFNMKLSGIDNRSVSPINHVNNTRGTQDHSMQYKLSPSPRQNLNQTLKRVNTAKENSGNQGKSFIGIVAKNSMKNLNMPLASQIATTIASQNMMGYADNVHASLALQAHKISNTELKLYQSCQKMVDAASKMVCASCQRVFQTTEFYDHIISQQSDCAKILCESNRINRMNSERRQTDDFTLCLEEESILQNNPVDYESQNNFTRTQISNSRGRAGIALNRSKDFIQSTFRMPQKDKFAMTHCSSDFRMLKNSLSNQSLTQRTNGEEQEQVSYRQNKMFQKEQTRNNASHRSIEKMETNYLSNRYNKSSKQCQLPRQMNNSTQRKASQQLVLETTNSIEDFSTNKQENRTLKDQYASQSQQYESEQNRVKEESESYEEDSALKEKRLRNRQNIIDDVGNEGNKSTYLRPSRNNKSAIELNRTANNDAQNKNNKQKQQNKENQQKQYKLNTCRNGNMPITFRAGFNTNKNTKLEELVNGMKNEKDQNKYVQDTFRAFQKVPYTSKKCGNRYNNLLRCSSSGSSNSFVSPKNLMFGIKQMQNNQLEDVSGFDIGNKQENQSSPEIGEKQKVMKFVQQSNSSGCLPSDFISPSLLYTNEQQCLEFENNENELMKIDQKQFTYGAPQTQYLNINLESCEDDVDLFGNQGMVINNEIQSSRQHHMTHELVASLIAQQEHKFATLLTSQNNLVVYESSSTSNLNSAQYKLTEDQYFTNGSSSASNVIIETKRGQMTSNSQRGRNQPKYSSTLNLRSAVKEQQMYVIRESCPSPLGEDELIDDFGCPFDPSSTTQQNIALLNSQYGLLSSKLPSQKQDQIVHILPKPKFIQTLPFMNRTRSITEMNIKRRNE